MMQEQTLATITYVMSITSLKICVLHHWQGRLHVSANPAKLAVCSQKAA
jgi:hypothetical protein